MDGVAFIDPKGSQVDIVQAVGRAIRLSEKKTLGTIFLPVFIKDGDDAEISIHSSNFKPIWNVLNALKSHDDVLSNELDQLRTNLGRRHGSGTIKGIPKVVIDLPRTVDDSFAGSLRTLLVEKTTESWNYSYGLLDDYVEKNGHARVTRGFETEDGYKLGNWVGTQRGDKDKLSPERKARLDSLGFIWDVYEVDWENGFSNLEKFVEKNGHTRVKLIFITCENYNLGSWVGIQRRDKDKLSPERIARLDSLGFDWDPINTQWEEGFSRLEKFFQTEGHARVTRGFETEDGYKLGDWVSKQRSNKNKLSPDRISKLNSLGFIWKVKRFNL